MKSLTIFSAAILALTVGCDDAPAQYNEYDNDPYSQNQSDQYQDQNNYNNQNPSQQAGYNQVAHAPNNGAEGITIKSIKDPNTGQTIYTIPIPTSWKLLEETAPGQPDITGPNGLTITEYPLQSYTYTNDPDMYRIMQQNGQKVVAPVGINNVMAQQVIPQGKQMGMTLLNQYPLPQVMTNETAFYSQLTYSNPQNKNQAIGSDWTDRDGNKIFVLLEYREMGGGLSLLWMYNATLLKVSQANFEKAKSQFIYAVSNKNFNPNIITNTNNQIAAQEKASNDHFQAMENIRRKGQRDRAKINADADNYVRNLRNQGNAFAAHNNDVVQQQESNYLNDVNVVVNPNDGKEYEVESGSNTYWMNNEGEYIKSDNSLYDPNKYEDYQGTWQEAPEKVYK